MPVELLETHDRPLSVGTPFLGVELPDSVLIALAKNCIMYSETTASFLGRGDHKGSYSELDLHGIMIYDTKAGRFVSNQGYVSVDTPPRGGVARFGSYIARYIGW